MRSVSLRLLGLCRPKQLLELLLELMFSKVDRPVCAGAETRLRRLQGAIQLMMLKTCLMTMMALTSAPGMWRQTAVLPTAVPLTGVFPKRLVDRPLTGTSGGPGMAMLEGVDRSL